MALDFARARKDGPRRTGRRRRRNGAGIRGFDALESRLLLSQGGDLPEVARPPALRGALEGNSSSPPPLSDSPVQGRLGLAPADGAMGAALGPPPLATIDVGGKLALSATGTEATPPDLPPWIIEAEAHADQDDSPQLFEMIGPHDRLENAQDMPNLDRFRIFGELAEGERYDMYRVNLADGVQSVQVDFRLRSSALQRGERIVLLDEQGNLLDDRPFDLSTGSVDLVLRATVPGSTQSVYVGIYRPDATAPPTPGGTPANDAKPFGDDGTTQVPWPATQGTSSSTPTKAAYSIQIAQYYGTPSDPTLPAPTPPSGDDASTPPTSGEPTARPSEDRPGTELQSAPVSSGSTAAGVTVVVRMVSGPSIDPAPRPARPSGLRSSAPAGGRLALGPPTRVVNRRDAAMLDLNLVDRPDLGNAEREPEDAPEAPSEQGAFYDGLRLFGADPLAPVGSSRGHGRRLVRSSALALGDLVAATADAPPPASTEASPTASPKLAATSGAVRAGLGLAYALTFTLFLPDLTDALRQAEERPRRRLRLAYLRRLLDVRRPCAALWLRLRGGMASRGR
jgi:hypothetical protein